MNKQLHPHLAYDDDETADSYIRRLAQFHTGRDGPSLLADLGITQGDFSTGADGALSKLSETTGISPLRLKAGWIRRVARYRELRGDPCSIDFIRPEGAFVCPECLQEDAMEGRIWLVKGQLSWRLRPVQCCARHHSRLVEPSFLHNDGEPASVFTSLSRIAQLKAEPQVPTALELSVVARLSGRPSDAGEWLDSQTLEQGVKACEMIGATLLHGLTFSHRALSSEDWREAGAYGFGIAREGVKAVMEALSRIADMSTTTAGQAGPKAVYGRLYEWLAYTSPVPEFGPIRGLLRENILNTIVIEPDAVLLGERVESRRLHSVYSLSIKTGLHLQRLRKILVRSGLADEDSWELAAHRLVFPVEEAEQLCRDIIDSVSLHQLPEAIGCSRTQAGSLYREKVISPMIEADASLGIGMLAFSRRDLESFLDQIDRLPFLHTSNPDQVDLTKAAKMTGRSTGYIVSRILSGNLKAYRVGSVAAVNGIRFVASNLDHIRSRKPPVIAGQQ